MRARRFAILSGGLALCMAAVAFPQTVYKYRGSDGEWIYTDRRPAEADDVEVRDLPATGGNGSVTLERSGGSGLVARNTIHAPVQLRLLPPGSADAGDADAREWVLPPQSVTRLGAPAPDATVGQRFAWMIGDPDARHAPDRPYRAPFPSAVSYRITQAPPRLVTHTTPDSAYAVDIAMPVGSNVVAARGGVVVEVAESHFRRSDTPGDESARANLVRILHDDGTFAIYAHLNWNSIRVQPGERVERGQYIANSGNTGFSTGPHLHFVVLRNAGMRLESLPITFADLDGEPVVPRPGAALRAY